MHKYLVSMRTTIEVYAESEQGAYNRVITSEGEIIEREVTTIHEVDNLKPCPNCGALGWIYPCSECGATE